MAKKREGQGAVRFSVSVDPRTHARLLALAGRQDVSLNWIVRRALGEFLETYEGAGQGELPLLPPGRESGA